LKASDFNLFTLITQPMIKKFFSCIPLATLLVTGILSTSNTVYAQKGKAFEGTIVYSIDVNGDALPPEAKQMFTGSEMTVALKGQKSRTDLKMGMQQTTAVSDAKAKTGFTLMDVMGQKFKINIKADDKLPAVKVKELSETKTIAGYLCKKAEVTADGSTEPFIVYYTEEIANTGYNSQIKGIKGYPLEFEVLQGGMKISYTAKSVNKEKIEDSRFEVETKDYKEVTREDLMKMFGGK
jgi:GLPGLI family protein